MKVNLLKLRTFPPSLKLSLGSTEFLQFEANRLRGSSIKPISSYRTYKQKSFEYLQYQLRNQTLPRLNTSPPFALGRAKDLKTKLRTFPWVSRVPQSKFMANWSRASIVIIRHTNRDYYLIYNIYRYIKPLRITNRSLNAFQRSKVQKSGFFRSFFHLTFPLHVEKERPLIDDKIKKTRSISTWSWLVRTILAPLSRIRNSSRSLETFTGSGITTFPVIQQAHVMITWLNPVSLITQILLLVQSSPKIPNKNWMNSLQSN